MPQKHKGYTVPPAANHLFKVKKMEEKIIDADAQTFHTIVAKIILLSKQS